MADALCGPSNALQTFQKQALVDRTLQQDRLISRQSPNQQGFRTQDSRSGFLDAEFEAFQAAQPLHLPQPDFSTHRLPDPRLQNAGPSFTGPVEQPGWAADFQRLQLVQSPATQHYQASQLPASSPQWNSIYQQQQVERQNIQPYGPSSLSSQYRPQFGMTGGFMPQQLPVHAPRQSAHVSEPVFDEAAFERAFDAARDQMVLDERQGEQQSDRTGPEAYPHLPLLRIRLFECLTDSSAEAIHQAAICLALLEEHDVDQMSWGQTDLFAPILRVFADDPLVPFQSRYNLRERARSLLDRFSISTSSKAPYGPFEEPLEGELHAAYTSALGGRRETNHLADSSSSPTRNAAMISNVEKVLSELGQGADARTVAFLTQYPSESADRSAPMVNILEIESALNADKMSTTYQSDLWQTLLHISGASASPEVVEAMANARTKDATSATGRTREDFQPQLEILEQQNRECLQGHRLAQSAMNQSHVTPEALNVQEQQDGHMMDGLESVFHESPAQQLHEPETQSKHDATSDDADQLAKTAAELLDKVSNNTTPKFQNSAFLGLMRKLRDREVKVEGDKMVETDHVVASTSSPDTRPTAVPAPFYSSSSLNEYNEWLPQGSGADQSRFDGQEVVDMLRQPNLDNPDTDFMMTSPFLPSLGGEDSWEE